MTLQKKKFNAEVGKVLNLVINSIYTNKDIFLRELLSNASDACDKLRYKSIQSPNLITKNHQYIISIEIFKKKELIVIKDSGIGMNNDDLIKHLGTIASSGTQNFLKQLAYEKKSVTQLIGKFGVGFYSLFMVSSFVTVITKKAGEKKTYFWSSDGKGSYTVGEYKEENIYGTKIILKIKKEEREYLDILRLKNIISTYSDHIAFPIYIINEQNNKEIVNKNTALWMRNPQSISNEEYEKFYTHISHYSDKPWLTIHNKIEGINISYINLLFIPKNKPFDLFHPDRKTKVKLYINRVLISEENNHLVPSYLRFLRGVVDSPDLPLNISRETIQSNHNIIKIKNLIVKKVLNNLQIKSKTNPEEYFKFLNNFGEVLKEGLCGESNMEEKEIILSMCRFQSTISNNDHISIDNYIKNMNEKQKDIYFLNGDSIISIKKNPQLEGFQKRGIEVILLFDHIDNFWVNIVNKYKNRELKSIISNTIDLNSIKELHNENKKEVSKEDYKYLINIISEVLKDKIKEVIVSSKLVNSPACISIPEGGINLRMEKFLQEQKQLHKKAARILEINPKHAIWKRVQKNINNKYEKINNYNIINVIYTQACLIEGDTIENPSIFAEQLNFLLSQIK
jgi:molecular chaperone HtpG